MDSGTVVAPRTEAMRCQVLGEESGVPSGTVATVIAPDRAEQRRGRTVTERGS
jgi:hypothetical protein